MHAVYAYTTVVHIGLENNCWQKALCDEFTSRMQQCFFHIFKYRKHRQLLHLVDNFCVLYFKMYLNGKW